MKTKAEVIAEMRTKAEQARIESQKDLALVLPCSLQRITWLQAAALVEDIRDAEPTPGERDQPIDGDAMIARGFRDAGINGYSMLLESQFPHGEIVELFIDFEFGASLAQGDDLVALTCIGQITTCRQVDDLLAALKGCAR